METVHFRPEGEMFPQIPDRPEPAGEGSGAPAFAARWCGLQTAGRSTACAGARSAALSSASVRCRSERVVQTGPTLAASRVNPGPVPDRATRVQTSVDRVDIWGPRRVTTGVQNSEYAWERVCPAPRQRDPPSVLRRAGPRTGSRTMQPLNVGWGVSSIRVSRAHNERSQCLRWPCSGGRWRNPGQALSVERLPRRAGIQGETT